MGACATALVRWLQRPGMWRWPGPPRSSSSSADPAAPETVHSLESRFLPASQEQSPQRAPRQWPHRGALCCAVVTATSVQVLHGYETPLPNQLPTLTTCSSVCILHGNCNRCRSEHHVRAVSRHACQPVPVMSNPLAGTCLPPRLWTWVYKLAPNQKPHKRTHLQVHTADSFGPHWTSSGPIALPGSEQGLAVTPLDVAATAAGGLRVLFRAAAVDDLRVVNINADASGACLWSCRGLCPCVEPVHTSALTCLALRSCYGGRVTRLIQQVPDNPATEVPLCDSAFVDHRRHPAL